MYHCGRGLNQPDWCQFSSPKKNWKFLVKIQLTKSGPKRTREWKVPCLMPIKFKVVRFINPISKFSVLNTACNSKMETTLLMYFEQQFRHGIYKPNTLFIQNSRVQTTFKSKWCKKVLNTCKVISLWWILICIICSIYKTEP